MCAVGVGCKAWHPYQDL